VNSPWLSRGRAGQSSTSVVVVHTLTLSLSLVWKKLFLGGNKKMIENKENWENV